MSLIIKNRSTHSQRLENWIGTETLKSISDQMNGFYGPPIAVSQVPGSVWAGCDGDFHGEINAGKFSNLYDHVKAESKRRYRLWEKEQKRTLGAGFSSIFELLHKMQHGQAQVIKIQKNTNNNGNTMTSWWAGGTPNGTPGSAAPSGRVPVSTDGNLFHQNPTTGNTLHFIGSNIAGFGSGIVQPAAGLLYDRIFDVAKTMNSTATEAVTGVPTRYQSQTATDQDYIGGNFFNPEVESVISSSAHDWTVCTYKNQDDDDATVPPFSGRNAALQKGCLDNSNSASVSRFWVPLEPGDVGIKTLTQMQCDTLITGEINFFIGHPLAWLPMPIMSQSNGGPDGGTGFFSQWNITSALNFVKILPDACLSIISGIHNSSCRYYGYIVLAEG